MRPDPDLVDTIKAHFARKSAAQLQEIVQSGDQGRWSPEAIAAAGEVLQDRLAGRALEPLEAEEEPPPPPHYDPDHFALAVALGGLGALVTGYLVIPYFRLQDAGEAPDLPVPFGPKAAWLALDTTAAEAVAAALGLREARAMRWAEGIAAAYQASVFVTPPLGDWTLAVSTALFPPDRADAFVTPLLERLSRQFGDAQYFCTHQDVGLHVWARARQGRLVRGYGWLGQRGVTLWDEGAQTREERDLGFRFLNPSSICELPKEALKEQRGRGLDITRRPPPGGKQGEEEAPKDLLVPDEDCVMQLASLWSIDPTSLSADYQEPATGLLGDLPGAGAERPDDVARTGITPSRGGKPY
jgi:hypothetical protein